MQSSADVVVCGGVVQSNTARQVAAACAKLGLECHLGIMHGRLAATEPGYQYTGNILLDRLFGALIQDIPWDEDRNKRLRGIADRIAAAGRLVYFVPYAKSLGAQVGATSRHVAGEEIVRDNGADHFFLDDGAIAGAVGATWAGGADKVFKLGGTATLTDALAAVRAPGIVCMAGMVGDRWSIAHFAPMDVIPTAVSLTTYSGGVEDFLAMPLQLLLDQVAAGILSVPIGRVFRIQNIVAAHRLMESNQAGGKIVVLRR